MRLQALPGLPLSCSGSAPRRCSTTCSCSAASSSPASTPGLTTSRSLRRTAAVNAGKARSGAAPRQDRAAVEPGTATEERARGRAAEPGEPRWQYAPAPESRDVVSIEPEYGLFVAGAFRPAADGRAFATINPATEEPLA